MRIVKATTCIAVAMLLFAGCVKEKAADPPTEIPVTLTLNLDLSQIADIVTLNRSKAAQGFDLHYVVDIYPVNGVQGERVFRKVDCAAANGTNVSIDVQAVLAFKKYQIRVWVDYVPAGSTDDNFYRTDDLCSIMLKGEHVGCVNAKDAFSGSKEVDLREFDWKNNTSVSTSIELERPHGMYKLVTTDLAELIRNRSNNLEEMPAYAVVSFPGFYPYGYNVLTQLATPDDFRTGIAYRSTVSAEPDGSVTLAFDYVFISNQNETVVHANLEVYDQNDKLINSVADIRIPIVRNRVTLIKGEFLTADYKGGDIGIDDKFDEEIEIILPD